MSADASKVMLPKSWEQKSIGDVCKVVSGSTPKTSVSDYWGGDIPWLTPNDLSKNRKKVVNGGERFITRVGFDSCSTQMVPKGSVLFTSRAPIGYVAIAGVPMCTNQGFKSAVPTSNILSEFLYWQLQNVTDDIRSRASGTTFLEISGRGFSATEIVIPPIDEQAKIVEILEEQLSRLDAALVSIHAARVKAARFRRSLLHAAFTGALTDHDTSMGTLPEGWRVSELGDIADTQLGKMLNSAHQTGAALKPYLRNINLQWGRIDLSDVKEMDIFENESEQFTLKKGDVLVCEGGEPGRSAVWNLDIEMAFQNAIHRIRPSDELLSAFACYQFEWLVKNGFLNENFTGVTIKHFSQQKLRRVKFVVPSLDEQAKIVEILEEQLSRLDASLAIMDAIESKSFAMRRSLLHSAFTGDLTREWREGTYV